MVAKKNGCKEYPTKDGDQLHYPQGGCRWVPNLPFEAVMTLTGVSRGRTAATAYWESDDGRKWTMFFSDLEALILHSTLVNGVTSGWWWVRKRGQNFGIEWLGEGAP